MKKIISVILITLVLALSATSSSYAGFDTDGLDEKSQLK